MIGMIACMSRLATTAHRIQSDYLPLVKSRQTLLLVLSGAAGYLCQRSHAPDWLRFLGLVASLVLTISGCTVLNMFFDRDIDRMMERTSRRPLAAGQVSARAAAGLGTILILTGLLWAWALSRIYFITILVGAGVDVVVYTLWLKRRSAWSILWGGIAGGMPILAGRVLAVGGVDGIGLLLALAIVCWIPSHNLTLGMLHQEDFQRAGVPTFWNVYGATATYTGVMLSSLLTAGMMAAGFALLGLSILKMAVLVTGSLGLVGLSVAAWVHPGREAVARLYKYSSYYMLAAMLLLGLAAFIPPITS
jgi:protoheme IX farnesyltransferase